MNLQSKKKYNGIEFFFREKYPEEFKEEVFIDINIIKNNNIDLRNTINNIGILNITNTGIQDAFERLYREINRENG